MNRVDVNLSISFTAKLIDVLFLGTKPQNLKSWIARPASCNPAITDEGPGTTVINIFFI